VRRGGRSSAGAGCFRAQGGLKGRLSLEAEMEEVMMHAVAAVFETGIER